MTVATDDPKLISNKLLTLDEATDPARCGHKAAALAALRPLGFDIPDGFVIPAGVTPSRDDIVAALDRLGDGPVAVRSSGLAEDLPDASFAGQYDTMLDVRGPDAVLDAAAKCVASANDERLSAYGRPVRPMAVLVQRMVDARVSGVAFSANPLTGDRDEVRVSATRGLADQLVSGAIDGDEWSVRAERALPITQPQRAIDPDLARQIAELARRAELARGAPQDIEWAVGGDRLVLLQSRPITVLPVAPSIEIPKGTWQKDAAHFPEPVAPFAASTHLHDEGQFIASIAEWGLMPDNMQARVIGHEFYTHVEPDDGGADPPPWWLIAVVARLLPSMRRKLKLAARAIDAGWLDSVPAEWASQQRPQLQKEIEKLSAIDLATLDDAGLFAHLAELRAFCARCMNLHFKLLMPHAVGLHELVTVCDELLGWDMQQTMRLLQGLSTTSSAAMHELAAIAHLVKDRTLAREVIESRRGDLVERLEQVDPTVAARLRQYLQIWGLRPFGSDAGSPSIAERPELVADLLADLIANETSAMPDLSIGRGRAVEEARAQLTDPAVRRRFDAALEYAERVYPLREDNVLLTDQIPTGLVRRVALEAGRRLTANGLLARADDAVMLTADELQHAVETSRDVRGLVSQRKAEHAWVRANPGPMTYGPEPGRMPDVRGLPAPARRINGALLWMLEQELSPPPQATAGVVTGIAASPGVYRGRVRIIHSAGELSMLRAGEVLVCSTTTAAWMMVFQRAGALVTDAGSVLSHTAIVAREFGLPAVVATANATLTLMDGEEVTVDGNRGTVERSAVATPFSIQ